MRTYGNVSVGRLSAHYLKKRVQELAAPATRSLSDPLAEWAVARIRLEGKPFRFEALGLPYFLDHAWKYLFAWYGEKKYGCVPDESADVVYYLIEVIDSPDFQLFAKNWLAEKSRVVELGPEIQIEDIRIIKGEEK